MLSENALAQQMKHLRNTFGKPPKSCTFTEFSSRRHFDGINIQERQMNNIRDNSGQVVSRRSRSLGKAKSKRQNGSRTWRGRKERRKHRCWTQQALSKCTQVEKQPLSTRVNVWKPSRWGTAPERFLNPSRTWKSWQRRISKWSDEGEKARWRLQGLNAAKNDSQKSCLKS
jgi:hypothetical protein